MTGWSTLTGGVIGVGVGEAAGAAIEPVLEPLKQDAWVKSQAKLLDLGVMARLVAQGLVDVGALEDDAHRLGYTTERLQAAVQLELAAAPVAELLELWRRGKISETLVDHGLAKAQIEPQYWAAIKELFYGRLDPAIIATAIQRGIMADPGFLPVGPPNGEGNVAAFPVSTLDPLAEAQAMGIDRDRLFVETAIVGLPLALVEAAQGYYRGILTLDDFKRAVAEGNTRNEWGDAALEVSRQILTAGEYAELQLRGYLTRDQRLAQTARHGMTTEDSDLLYDVLGRAPAVHGVTTGLARGGVYKGPTDQIPQVYLDAMERSNARPEWYSIDYANRYSYPSAFVVRSLLTDGAITQAEGEQIFLDVGWRPDLAAKVAEHYQPSTSTSVDANVKKAHTKAWTEAQTSYIAQESTAADVQPIFTLLGLDPQAQTDTLAAWDAIRALVRKQLTPTEIRKALGDGLTNPATGVAWTTADATAALLARGYDAADAQVFLEE